MTRVQRPTHAPAFLPDCLFTQPPTAALRQYTLFVFVHASALTPYKRGREEERKPVVSCFSGDSRALCESELIFARACVRLRFCICMPVFA